MTESIHFCNIHPFSFLLLLVLCSNSVFEMFDDLLLLKKGGEVVFHGELGANSSNLISYFEGLGSTKINRGENPASWMLNVLNEKNMIERDEGEDELIDFAKAWKESSNNDNLQQKLIEATESPDDALKITYDTKFAVSWFQRDRLMAGRLSKIYWRCPAYNLARLALSAGIAFLLGSVFLPIRENKVFTEPQISR